MHNFLKKHYSKSQRPFISVPSDYHYFTHRSSSVNSAQRKKDNYSKIHHREIHSPTFEKALQLTKEKRYKESNAILLKIKQLEMQSMSIIHYQMAINYRELNDYQSVLASINEFLYNYSDDYSQNVVDKFIMMKKSVNKMIKSSNNIKRPNDY